MHGRTIRLYMTTGQARGVIRGTEVWLDGLRVGRVAGLTFEAPTADTARRLVLALDILESARPRVRRDTRAEIRTGTSMLGSPVVQLVGGSSAATEVGIGDTLVSVARRPWDGERAELARAAQDLPVVLENFNAVRHQLFSESGTIGAFGNGAGIRHLHALHGDATRLRARASERGGTVGQLARGDLIARAQRVLAAADSLAHAATGPGSAMARVGSDTALAHDVRDARAELAAVAAGLGDPAATPPGPAADVTALRARLRAADARLRGLETDIARRPLRYLVF